LEKTGSDIKNVSSSADSHFSNDSVVLGDRHCSTESVFPIESRKREHN